jgi:hypothetical protein
MMSPKPDMQQELMNQMAPHTSNKQRIAMPVTRSDACKFLAILSAVFIAAMSPRDSFAALGEPEASVHTDVAQFQASIKSSLDRAVYRVHEIQLPSGTLLREFVSPDGIVFAVAWNGPHVPNLRQVLGKYFDSFVAGAKVSRAENHSDRNHLTIQQADFVVEAGGHMRAFAGRAYLPAAMPSGINLGDLH